MSEQAERYERHCACGASWRFTGDLTSLRTLVEFAGWESTWARLHADASKHWAVPAREAARIRRQDEASA